MIILGAIQYKLVIDTYDWYIECLAMYDTEHLYMCSCGGFKLEKLPKTLG